MLPDSVAYPIVVNTEDYYLTLGGQAQSNSDTDASCTTSKEEGAVLLLVLLMIAGAFWVMSKIVGK